MVLVVLAFERQPLVRQPGDEDCQRFVEDRACVRGIDPKVPELVGRDTTADAQIQPPARQVVQHADFFDKPQRVVER